MNGSLTYVRKWSGHDAVPHDERRAPWNQVEGPCAVCGKFEDACICPECPQCHAQGDPNCYVHIANGVEDHGLVRSSEQIESLRAAEEEWERQAAAGTGYGHGRNKSERAIYAHSWATGHQSLVFDNEGDARLFAVLNGLEFTGPRS